MPAHRKVPTIRDILEASVLDTILVDGQHRLGRGQRLSVGVRRVLLRDELHAEQVALVKALEPREWPEFTRHKGIVREHEAWPFWPARRSICAPPRFLFVNG